MKFKGIHIFAGMITACVIAVVILGFVSVGSPKQQRARRLDQQRANDLQQLTYTLDNFYATKKTLPDSLQELKNVPEVSVSSSLDPATGQPYEYRKLAADKYELCATFETVVSSTASGISKSGYTGPFDRFWDHPAGRSCFELFVRTANKTP